MENINQLIALAAKSGFDTYGSFKEEDFQHDILTCTKGKYDGQVIDLYYDYYTGNVAKVEYSTQFRVDVIQPVFCFPSQKNLTVVYNKPE